MKTCHAEAYHPCKTTKVGCPISNTTAWASQSVSKRRKSNYSVNKSIRLENLGCHWVIYVSGRGRCEVCSQNKVDSRPQSKFSACSVFLCCNEKKIALLFIFQRHNDAWSAQFLEYLQTLVLSKPTKFSFFIFSYSVRTFQSHL